MSGCTPRDSFDRLQILDGPNPEIDQTSVVEFATHQRNVVDSLALLAGLTPPSTIKPPITDTVYWNSIVDAGVLYVDKECDQYMNALFWFNRASESAKTSTATTGAATAAAMGVLGAATSAISLTAVAFGLASSLIDTGSDSMLYSINPSSIRVILKKSQEEYLKQITAKQNKGYNNQAKALSAVQGYLAMCLPANLETMINNAVVTATVQVGSEGKRVEVDLPNQPNDNEDRIKEYQQALEALEKKQVELNEERQEFARRYDNLRRNAQNEKSNLEHNIEKLKIKNRSLEQKAKQEEYLDSLRGKIILALSSMQDTDYGSLMSGVSSNFSRDKDGFSEWTNSLVHDLDKKKLCSGQAAPDTFKRDSSKSMGDKSPLAECNRVWL